MFGRKSSQVYRDRPSVVVVQDTRGLPLTILSYILSLQFAIAGLRHIFFCNVPISGTVHERQMLSQMFSDCTNNKHGQFASDMLGIYLLTQAAIRFHMATAIHVADLYLTLLILTMADVCMLLAVLRRGIEDEPIYYVILGAGSILYEALTLVEARKAYLSRLKMKKITADRPFSEPAKERNE